MESGWFSVLKMVALVIVGAWTLQGCTNGVGQIDARTIWAARLGAAIRHADGARGSLVAPTVWGSGLTGAAAVAGAGRESAGASLADRVAVAATITDLLVGGAVVRFAPLGRCPGRARCADI